MLMLVSQLHYSWARWKGALSIAYFTVLLLAGLLIGPMHSHPPATAAPGDIHKIKHIVIIMQENRSYDTYFGTYPGGDGLPRTNSGAFSVCVSNPQGGCVQPYHDSQDLNAGGPHGAQSAVADINAGRMDGFVAEQQRSGANHCRGAFDPRCGSGSQPDAMGYHDAREIPNYWQYAQDFVLQDHMFEPNASWSLPEHLFMVSGWSARCASSDPMSCVNELERPQQLARRLGKRPGMGTAPGGPPDYAWTDLTYLLHKNHVSWAYYLAQGTQPDCQDDQMYCASQPQTRNVPQIWNPLPWFDTVKQDGELGNVEDISNFFTAAKAGTLPAVSWVVPNGAVSEHPPGLVSAGQAYVTSVINAVMRSPDWNSTAIFVSWDDWGGFYDHVVPPQVDQNGYGLRVPGLLISPYARKGYIDHQTLSFDAYLKFIEDDFLNASRIDPRTDGRPDPRPDVRENASQLGNLLSEFDFSQAPRPPVLLPVNPTPGPASH
jgi:phospholipase C